ncbi:hypothetical protein BDR05DRAFT_1012516 [Suillus weaverae]|nr:hypothetical protein BDR05DRAFT_1012516 [Suillus weaverae]
MLLVNLTQQLMIVCGLNGPIVTQSAYIHHKEVKAALGVKLVAPDLDKTVAGSQLLVAGPDDDEEALLREVMSDLSGRGVCVQASTCKIPVSGINIGPVHKKDVMRAATMLEKAKELAVILCFHVPVDKDSEQLAEETGIKAFKGFSFRCYSHLFDAFTAKRRDAAPQAIGRALRVGTPICVVTVDPTTEKKQIIDFGKVTSLDINHKSSDLAPHIVKKSQSAGDVCCEDRTRYV